MLILLLKLCLFTKENLVYQVGQWLLVLAADPSTGSWLLCCCFMSSTFMLRGKERRLSLPVPLDHSFTSAHFHGSIISHIQREIFPQIIQSMRSWSRFVKHFVILVGKTLQKSWCTTQMVFRVVLPKVKWLLTFPPAFISVFIAHIHQAVFRKSDVIIFIIVRCDIFLVLHFIILCKH